MSTTSHPNRKVQLTTSHQNKKLSNTTVLQQKLPSKPLRKEPIQVTRIKQFHQRKIKEIPLGSNSGPVVDSINKFCHVKACAWCGSTASVCRDGTLPYVRSALAIDHAPVGYRVSIQQVILGSYIPKPGDFLVKARVGGHHVDILIEYDAETMTAIVGGGNVGDAVTIRKVKITIYKFISYTL